MHLTEAHLCSIFKSVVELKEAIRALESQLVSMDAQISKQVDARFLFIIFRPFSILGVGMMRWLKSTF